MPIDAQKLASGAAKTGGAAAGLGAGAGLSYGFFEQAHGADLLQRGDAYGLTAFAFIALILLIGGYIALPENTGDQVRKTITHTLAVFAVLSIGGFLFQVISQGLNPQVTINAGFEPQLSRLNQQYNLDKAFALAASIKDGHGNRQNLVDGQDVKIPVQNGLEVTVSLETLDDAMRHVVETKVAKAACVDCDLQARGGDDAGGP